MILGYANCGEGDKALQVFQQMQQEGVQPNTVTECMCQYSGT
jgi:pentatricopeptide repeat protein